MVIVNCYYANEQTFTEIITNNNVWHWKEQKWIKFLKKHQSEMQKWVIENNVIKFKVLEFME